MHRLFGFLAIAFAAVALSVLLAGPAVGPLSGGRLTPGHYRAWAAGVLTGLVLAWLASLNWKKIEGWWGQQRRRLGLLAVGGLLAALVLAMFHTAR